MANIFVIKDGNITDEVNKDFRGRPIKCQKCKSSFRFENDLEKENWEDDKLKCPICGELRCNKPKTERHLFYLQDEYLKTFEKYPDKLIVLDQKKKHKIETEFYNVLSKYVKSLLFKYFRSQVKDCGDIENYIHSAVIKLLEKYYRTDKQRWLDFKIDESFGGMFVTKGRRGLIAEALFEKSEVSEGDVTINYKFSDNNDREYEDEAYCELDNIDNKIDIQDIISHIVNVIIHIKKYCNTAKENFIRLHTIKLYYTEGEGAFDRYFKVHGSLGKDLALKTIKTVKKEIEYIVGYRKNIDIKKEDKKQLTKLEMQRKWMMWSDKDKYKLPFDFRKKWYSIIDYKSLTSFSKKLSDEFLVDYFD